MTDTAKRDDVLWTVEDVARFLGVTPRTVYEVPHYRTIPRFRIGSGRGVLRYRPSDVRQWLEAHREG